MNSYDNLDLNIIKGQIAQAAAIKEAASFLMEERVDFNPLKIRHNCEETKEALKILKEGNVISFDGIRNVNDLLEKADRNIALNGIELKNILVFHHHSLRIKKQFQKFDPDLSIRDYSDSISVSEKVFDRVEDCIDNSGEIKENASERLKAILSELSQCEKELLSRAQNFIEKHQSSLQESSIYMRNERITFLVKNSDKNKYNGYTYGTSASGLASYVEPASFIELNNKKLRLIQDREDEIERILRELSYLVSSVSDLYYHNFESLVKLCVIFAKAQYGMDRDGIVPEIIEGVYFDLQDLAHPLIDPKKVVTNSYRLYEPYRGIVISGSNTGGKTVSLKSIGLSILMTYLGIPIIASKGKVPLYRNIFIDIDDNQSIQDSLSTFSAHITNINDILKKADERSLILIDELISGTDPKEAQAISLAILDKIKELRSVFIITTHFDEIKNYSYKDEEILLSSVGFNMETLSPTYHYLEDSVGSSNALEIASRYFEEKEIIDNARHYLELNRTREEELMDRLSRQIEETNAEKEKLQKLEEENRLLKQDYEKKIADFDAEKAKLREDYVRRLNDELDEIRLQALEKLDSIQDKKKDAQVVKQIEELRTEEKEVEKPVEFHVNDNVRIKDSEQIGVITQIQNDSVTVSIRGLTIRTKKADLTLMPKTVKKKTKVVSEKYKRIASEINLVGQRVEDGLAMMEEYLDRANAAHMSTVKVIHGIGTGTLRSALRQRLKKLSYVKSFKDGDYYDGGSAVTIVEFKQ